MKSYKAFDKHIKNTEKRLKDRRDEDLKRQKQEYEKTFADADFRSRMSTGNIHIEQKS